MLFENHEIDVSQLPKVEAGEFTKLDSNYLVVRYIGSFIFFMIVGFGIIGSYLLTDISDTPKVFWGLVAFWIFWATTSFVLTTMGYKIRGYRLRDKDIVHRKGVIFKSVTTVPFNRVQHCEVNQGVIQRMFDLYTLQIFTAGGSNSDLSIPGLKDDTAQRIKEFIIKKADLAVETEQEEGTYTAVEIAKPTGVTPEVTASEVAIKEVEVAADEEKPSINPPKDDS
ncbi:MAG: PH domain-containing protein [Bacteroidota bacterium]